MEHVADALKIALAVFIFALAFTILFNTASLARRTAEEAIIGADRTEYYTYLEKKDNSLFSHEENGATVINRKVTLEDMIPTIYRYSIESYGVTIIDLEGNIVTRFDRDTENLASTFYSANVITEEKEKLMKEINAYVLKPVKAQEIKGINGIDKENSLEWLFAKIYKQETDEISGGQKKDRWDRKKFDCPWQSAVASDNGSKDGWIAQRIDSDLSGFQAYFDLGKAGIQSEEESAKNHIPCLGKGKGIIEEFTNQNGKSKIFLEYMITHDTNYPTRDDENGDWYYIDENSGTTRNPIKREIIYVETEEWEE